MGSGKTRNPLVVLFAHVGSLRLTLDDLGELVSQSRDASVLCKARDVVDRDFWIGRSPRLVSRPEPSPPGPVTSDWRCPKPVSLVARANDAASEVNLIYAARPARPWSDDAPTLPC